LEKLAEGFLWHLPEFGRRIPSDFLHGAETTDPATCRAVSSEIRRATSAKLAHGNDH
jgi:hypothetical protein